MRTRAVSLLCLAALFGAACGGASGTETTGAGAAGQSEPPAMVGEPARQAVASDDYPRAGGEPALLGDVWASSHDGFDRVVVELRGDTPSYRVAPVEGPVALEDSDDPAPIAGTSFIEVRLAPASVLTPSGARSFEGPDRVPVPDGGVVTEVVRTGGTGGPLTFAVGLDAPASFAVALREAQLVVDIAHGS